MCLCAYDYKACSDAPFFDSPEIGDGRKLSQNMRNLSNYKWVCLSKNLKFFAVGSKLNFYIFVIMAIISLCFI